MNRDTTGAVTALRALLHNKRDTMGRYYLVEKDELDAALDAAFAASPPEDAPAVDGGDAWTVASLRGFERAFWELAEIMQIGAQPLTPKQVWETQMRPTLQRMFAAAPAPAVGRGDDGMRQEAAPDA